MREMPTFITDPVTGDAVEVPVAQDWIGSVQRLVGRPLTAQETATAEQMARKNWTVRVAAEAILGRDLTQAEVDAASVR